MTELLTESKIDELLEGSFDRQQFIKGGGALVIGFSLAGSLLTNRASGATQRIVAGPPDANAIDSWIVVHENNTVTMYMGKIDITGSPSGLLQVAAEELDMTYDQVKAARVDTHLSPNQGATVGSNGISSGTAPVRQAAAEARAVLLGLAAKQLGVPVSQLTVDKGVVSVKGDASKTVTYGALLGGKRFAAPNTGRAPQKHYSDYKVIGKPQPRKDTAEKVAGTYAYVHNLRLPGMLHGRVVRPLGQGPYAAPGTGAEGGRELDQEHQGRPDRPQGRLPRRRRDDGAGRDPGCDAAEGHLGPVRHDAGQRQPLGCLPQGHGRRAGGREHRQDRRRPRSGGQHPPGELRGRLPVARVVRAVGRRRRRQVGLGTRDDGGPERLRDADDDRRTARDARRPGADPVLRGRGLLRPQPPGRRRPGCGHHVSARRQAGACPAHPRPGARLGLLRPRHARGHPRRRGRERQGHRVRLRVVPAGLERRRDDGGDARHADPDERLRRRGRTEQRCAVRAHEPAGDREEHPGRLAASRRSRTSGPRPRRRRASPRSR